MVHVANLSYTKKRTSLVPISQKKKKTDKTHRVCVEKSLLNKPSDETRLPCCYVSKHQHLYLNLTRSFAEHPHQRKLNRFAAYKIILLLFKCTNITVKCREKSSSFCWLYLHIFCNIYTNTNIVQIKVTYRNVLIKLIFERGKYFWGKTRKTPEGPLYFTSLLKCLPS